MTVTEDPTKQYYPLPPVEQAIEHLQGMTEIWAPVQWPGLAPGYTISTEGEVKNNKGLSLKPTMGGGHQQWVGLKRSDGGRLSVRIDKLMLTTFVGLPPSDEESVPRHEDGDTANNRLTNLRWDTAEHPEASPRSHLSTRAKKSKSAKKAPTKKSAAAIVITRTYSCEDVTITVGEDGALRRITPDPNKRLSPHQTMLLCTLMARVGEMNAVLGVQ